MPRGVPSKVQANIRDSIKVQELIDIVQNNTLANRRPINRDRLTQIKLLLAKALPDIKVQEITGQVDSTVTIVWEDD